MINSPILFICLGFIVICCLCFYIDYRFTIKPKLDDLLKEYQKLTKSYQDDNILLKKAIKKETKEAEDVQNWSGGRMKKQSKLSLKARGSGILLREIAARRGVTPSVITRQMAAGVKTLRVAREYAAVLDCDPVELLD